MTTNTTITPELLDQLLANYEKPEDLTGDDGLFKQLKKALIERAPDVDGQILLNDGFADPGTFARVTLTETAGYDLVGRIVGAA